MDVIIAGGGIGGLAAALALHRIGITRGFTSGRRDPPARRRHQPAAPRGAGARPSSGCSTRWSRRGRATARADLLQQARPARSGASRAGAPPATPGRSSRSTAASCRWHPARAVRERLGADADPARPSPGRFEHGRRAARSARFAGAPTASRCAEEARRAGRRRRHPLRRPRAALPRGGPADAGTAACCGAAATERAAVPGRPHDDHGRPPGPEVRRLPDRAAGRRRARR